MARTSLVFVLTACVTVTAFGACRFVVPGVPEQKKLMEDKTFPAGAPPWIANRVDSVSNRQGGLIPQSYTPPMDVSGERPGVATAGPRGMETKEAQKRAGAETSLAVSPLERISSFCPGTDDDVTSAMTTLDRTKRIEKYQSLTKTCPRSADLWLWLAVDYQKSEQFIPARRAYEQVLILDAHNDAARRGLAEVNSQVDSSKK